MKIYEHSIDRKPLLYYLNLNTSRTKTKCQKVYPLEFAKSWNEIFIFYTYTKKKLFVCGCCEKIYGKVMKKRTKTCVVYTEY